MRLHEAGHAGWPKITCAALAIAAGLGFANSASAKVTFFTLPGGTLLTVEAANSGPDVTGEWMNSEGKFSVFVRTVDGTVTDHPVANLGRVAAIDDNYDLIGTFANNPNEWIIENNQQYTIDFKKKGATATFPKAVNDTSGDIISYYLDKAGNAVSHRDYLPTQSGLQNGDTIKMPRAQSTMAETTNSSGNFAGQYQDLAGWHGFFAWQGGAYHQTFDITGATGTFVTQMDDANDFAGSYTYTQGGTSHTAGYVLMGDLFVEGSQSGPIAKLPENAVPSVIVTLTQDQNYQPTSDLIIAYPNSYTLQRDPTHQTFGRLTKHDITVSRCSTSDPIKVVGASVFNKQIVGYCTDSTTNQAVGFLIPLQP